MDFNTIGTKLKTTHAEMQLKTPAGFDLYAYQDVNGRWGLTTDPDDEALAGAVAHPCILKVVGQDSKEFRQRRAEVYARIQTGKKMTFQESQREAVRSSMAAVIGWSHIVWNENPTDPESKPKLLEFSEDNLELFFQKYPPARDQVDAFFTDRANFFSTVNHSS